MKKKHTGQNRVDTMRSRFFGDARFSDLRGRQNAPLLLPIRLTVIYLIISVVVYIICPFEWITYKPVLFYGLLTLYVAALWFGYRLGLMKPLRKKYEWKESDTSKLISIISVLIVVEFCAYVINIFRDYMFNSLDFVGLAKQMWVGIQNPGLGYGLRLKRLVDAAGSNVIGGTAFSLFNYIWAFVRYPIMILSMLYFTRLKWYGKVFTVLYLVLTLAFYLSIGTTIDILTVFLLIVLPVILDTFSVWKLGKINRKQIIKLIAIMLAGIMLIFSYFTWMMVSRGSINYYDSPNYNVGGIGVNLGDKNEGGNTTQTTTDPTQAPDKTPTTPTEGTNAPAPTEPSAPSAPVKKTGLSRTLMKFWVSFSSYFTQGYYAFSQSLTLPWTPMYGAGNSMFVVDFVTEHFHDIDQYTYQGKLEDEFGWDARVRWHSMYTWLANDVSVYGVVIVMLLIGLLFGMMFKDAITSKNPFAKAGIFYFILMILFIPCNNQLGQRPATMFSFVFIILCWIVSMRPPKFLRKLLGKK